MMTPVYGLEHQLLRVRCNACTVGAVTFTIEGGDIACGCPKMRAIEHCKGTLHKRNALAS